MYSNATDLKLYLTLHDMNIIEVVLITMICLNNGDIRPYVEGIDMKIRAWKGAFGRTPQLQLETDCIST